MIYHLEEKIKQLENDNMVLVRSLKESQDREDAHRREQQHQQQDAEEDIKEANDKVCSKGRAGLLTTGA